MEDFELNRDVYQDIVCLGLSFIGCNSYGSLEDARLEKTYGSNYRGGITTPVFETNPYWWGNSEKDEDDPIECAKPNFRYNGIPGENDHLAGLELRWYKYALRGGYANMDVSPEDLKRIFLVCSDYVSDGYWKSHCQIVRNDFEEVIVQVCDNSNHEARVSYEKVPIYDPDYPWSDDYEYMWVGYARNESGDEFIIGEYEERDNALNAVTDYYLN